MNCLRYICKFAHVSKQFGASNLNTNFISLYGALLQWRRSYSAFCKGLGLFFFVINDSFVTSISIVSLSVERGNGTLPCPIYLLRKSPCTVCERPSPASRIWGSILFVVPSFTIGREVYLRKQGPIR